MAHKRTRYQRAKRNGCNKQSKTAEGQQEIELNTCPTQRVQDQTKEPGRQSLLILPNELLLEIGDTIVSQGDLSALARTCRRVYVLLNWKLYRKDARADKSRALLWAVRHSELETVLLSLEAGANVHATYYRGEPYWIDVTRPREITTLLHEAVIGNSGISWMTTPFLMEMYKKRMRRHLQIMQLLIDRGININAQGTMQGTALSEALWHGEEDSIKLLLENGAMLIDPQPMQRAAHKCSVSSIRLLIAKGADIEEPDSDDCTPLFTAAKQANERAAAALIKAGANVAHKAMGDQTALHAAANSSSRLEKKLCAVTRLLLRHGAEVDAQMNHGETPLQLAIENKHVLMVEYLLKAGANPDIRRNDGQTAVHILASTPNERIRTLLVRSKASFTLKDNRGRTPLHIACQSYRPYFVEDYCWGSVHRDFKRENIQAETARQNLIYWLLKKGTSDVRDNNGRTPLHLAVVENDERMVKVLTRESTNCNLKDNDGNTPLHLAVIQKETHLIADLIGNGADGEAKDFEENTPLHVAVKTWPQGVKELLHWGVDSNSKDSCGRTPLHAALLEEHPNQSAIEALFEHGALADVADARGLTPEKIAGSREEPWLLKLFEPPQEQQTPQY